MLIVVYRVSEYVEYACKSQCLNLNATYRIKCSSCHFQVDASKVGGGPGGAAATSEGVLANFFNSLLSKKTGGAAGGAPGAPGVGGSPGGVGGMGPNGQIMGASPGGVAGGGSPGGIAGSGAQLKAAGDNDECELIADLPSQEYLHSNPTILSGVSTSLPINLVACLGQ